VVAVGQDCAGWKMVGIRGPTLAVCLIVPVLATTVSSATRVVVSDETGKSREKCLTGCGTSAQPVACFANPCDVTKCDAAPDAECEADMCGGCRAWFKKDGEYVKECNPTCDNQEPITSRHPCTGELVDTQEVNCLVDPCRMNADGTYLNPCYIKGAICENWMCNAVWRRPNGAVIKRCTTACDKYSHKKASMCWGCSKWWEMDKNHCKELCDESNCDVEGSKCVCNGCKAKWVDGEGNKIKSCGRVCVKP